jgi:hypothetical protein
MFKVLGGTHDGILVEDDERDVLYVINKNESVIKYEGYTKVFSSLNMLNSDEAKQIVNCVARDVSEAASQRLN